MKTVKRVKVVKPVSKRNGKGKYRVYNVRQRVRELEEYLLYINENDPY